MQHLGVQPIVSDERRWHGPSGSMTDVRDLSAAVKGSRGGQRSGRVSCQMLWRSFPQQAVGKRNSLYYPACYSLRRGWVPLVWAIETQEKFVRFPDGFSPFDIEGQSTSDIEVVEHMFQGQRWGLKKALKYDGLIEMEVRDHFREK